MADSKKHLTANTHKARGQWFLQRSIYPLRDAPPAALEKFWDNPNRFHHAYGVNWEEAGPFNYPGRVTSLAANPAEPSKLYAGSAAGGVWVSSDSAATWTSCWPRLLNQHIGALAMDPVDSNVLFCATGEGNLSADSYCGSGVYQTDDGGFTWSLELSGSRRTIPRRVGSLAFMLAREKGVYGIVIAAVSTSETMPAALYIDQGGTGVQPCLFWGNRNYNCHSVAAHPTKQGLLYAAIEPRGLLNGIWRSDDFGATWTHLKAGLPAGDLCQRISLAISPSDPEILFAMVGGQDGCLLGVFRTKDGGDHWRNVAGGPLAQEGRLSYNNTIAVHPDDPDVVLCGAVDLHLTRNGGRSWIQCSTGQRGCAGQPIPSNYVHSDHHALVITRDGVFYSGNDGGVARSSDGGMTWQSASEGMVTALFYAADVAQSDSKIYGGGLQDNGTLIAGVPANRNTPAPAPGRFTRVLGGDGGWIAFDPDDAEHVFGSTSDMTFYRHRRREAWAAGDQLAGWPTVSIDPALLLPGESQLRLGAVLAIARRRDGGRGKVVYAGTARLWRTLDDGCRWRPCSPPFDGTAVSAIACAPENPDVIFVGTSGGSIYRTKNGGKTWSNDIAGPAIPKRVITSIRFHPASRRSVYVSVAATGVQGAVLEGSTFEASYGHVYRSENSGDTWEDIDNGELPDVVFNALAFESRPPYRLFAGGDAGVWILREGRKWGSIAGNMPNVVVSDLNFHRRDHILTAATYGRGIWRLRVDDKLPEPVAPHRDAGKDVCAAVGLQCDWSKPAPKLQTPLDGAVFDIFPRTTNFTWSPVPGAIGYSITNDYEGDPDVFSSRTNEATRQIAGANRVKWQVWAIFPGGWRSPGSAVRELRYTR